MYSARSNNYQFYKSLVWPYRGSNLWYTTALDARTLTITPPTRFSETFECSSNQILFEVCIFNMVYICYLQLQNNVVKSIILLPQV